MERNENVELLDKLVRSCGCRFVSDLPMMQWRAKLLAAVTSMNAAAYSADAWLYAATYITSNQIAWDGKENSTSVSAQNALQGWLLKNQKV